MHSNYNKDVFLQLEEHLKCNEQSWLVGAGISFDAKLPLMYPLTNKVKFSVRNKNSELYDNIVEPLINELPDDNHIEHILSHLGDYAALAERSKDKVVKINDRAISLDEIVLIHDAILEAIVTTIKSGYKERSDGSVEEEGTVTSPIVSIEAHDNFIDVLFNYLSAGIYERRKPVNIFTTNYDTLIEDALALNKIPYWDGFSGGAVAYRTLKYGDSFPSSGYRAHLVKMHGSIDWHLCDRGYIWRVRDTDIYPASKKKVLIYPQSTKYIATQQDPFATQFDLFRRTLNSSSSNVLIVCGYSFGDSHINNEIEFALSKSENKTVVIAFVEAKETIPGCLKEWQSKNYGKRIIIATINGLFVGENGPYKRVEEDDYWWTFKGVTTILKNGCEV